MANTIDLREQWADLARRFKELRPLAARCDGLLSDFDEFLEHNEFEVGLHILCDCLVAADGPMPTIEQIQRIETLHERMELRDDCVDRLKAKLALCGEYEV